MLLIRTFLAPSQIQGLGLFAGENVPEGTVVWTYVPTVDKLIDIEDFDKLPCLMQEVCKRYAYLDNRTTKYVLCGDDARFVNHSDLPNTVGRYPEGEIYGIDVATRLIKQGEEITCDYSTFDAEFACKLRS